MNFGFLVPVVGCSILKPPANPAVRNYLLGLTTTKGKCLGWMK
ncbi:MAG: hypothetical protein QG662_260 [Pseudomonadota bacterium]|nr:hypothetical protein [Pseudomonadota bacterium]